MEQTAFTGASWPRTSRTLSRPGTPEGLHGGVHWPRRLSAPLLMTGASNPAGRVAMTEGPVQRHAWRGGRRSGLSLHPRGFSEVALLTQGALPKPG